MQPETQPYLTMVGDKPVTMETGRLAGQAGGAVTVRLGDTVVFAAATMGDEPRQGVDFFPLTVDYEERMMLAAHPGLFGGGQGGGD
jgi:polyribonucleotide nucleotidyltransferase